MKRESHLTKGRLEIRFSDVSENDRKKVLAAIESFRTSSNQPVDRIAARLEKEFGEGRITPKSIEKLSRWMNTDGSYAASVDSAQKLALELFGLTFQRLVSSEGKRVPDYAAVVADIHNRI